MGKYLTTEKFISQAKNIHNERYDYSKVEYIGTFEKICIICKEHGEFWQTPNHHKNNGNCPKCQGIKNGKKYARDLKDFIDESNKVHNNKYDYSLSNYIKTTSKVNIICPVHGLFNQMASEHLRGIGCEKCGFSLMWKNRRPTNYEFIEKSIKIHGLKYDYSKTNYTTWDGKVIINCFTHGDFEQSAHVHLSGAGCPICGKELNGWSRSKFIERCESGDGILYFVKIFNKNEIFIKIGITSVSIDKRLKELKSIGYNYIILKELITDGGKVWDAEKELHRKFKEFSYKPKISFGGETECFTMEIENLIENYH